MSPPTVSVIIPARNAADLIGLQLAALGRQTHTDFEVVVSDNGSTDDTVAVARALAGGLDLRVVDASARPGVSHARNVGLRAGLADKLLICDADDEVAESWVAAMAAALDDHDLVTGTLEVTKLNSDERARTFIPPMCEGLPLSMGFRPYAFGGNLGVRRDLFDRLGGFDEEYTDGHEDVEFSWRAIEHGATLSAVPGGVIHYRLRGSRGAVIRRQFRSGKSYARLYRDYRWAGIPATPLRRELGFYARLVTSLPRNVREGELDRWLVTAAWAAGRLTGDGSYGVRCPL